MVVCRLRRNIDFRMNSTSNRASTSQRHSTSAQDTDGHVPEEVRGLIRVGGGLADGEFHSKKSSSSYDSHSLEQIDSASESNQQLVNELTQTESSSHPKVSCFLSTLGGLRCSMKMEETSESNLIKFD